MRGASIFVGMIGLFLFAPKATRAQAPPRLEFEVASVRRLAQPAASSSHTSVPGRVSYTNQVLRPVLVEAYGANVFGPDWLDSERYDISATFPEDATKQQVSEMLRNLLMERFHLMVHKETRAFPAYDLTVAKNGPKLKEWVEGATTPALPALRPDEFAGLRRDGDGFPQMPRERSGIVVGFTGAGRVHLVAVQQTIAQLIDRGLTTDPITDKTGLRGKYDFTMDFERLDAAAGPDLLAAIQQQLGLKLEAKKVPAEVVVVDHIEKAPAEN